MYVYLVRYATHSGSSIYGIFDNEEDAIRLCKKKRREERADIHDIYGEDIKKGGSNDGMRFYQAEKIQCIEVIKVEMNKEMWV
jgi:carbamoylphosphate synthase large subunit